jgi:hypothetical protein
MSSKKNSDNMKALIRSLKDKDVILFVGAGVSMGVGAPSWSKLMNFVAKDCKIEPEIFHELGDNYSLAEYHRISHKDSNGKRLRKILNRELHRTESKTKVAESEVHKILTQLPTNVIYTTNYDHYLEWAFKNAGVDIHKITKASDIGKVSSATRQIVKFHGDLCDDSKLVFSETDYFERLSFETALDIKLRSDLLNKSVLFIGYSFSDFNVRLMFHKLNQLYREANSDGPSKNSHDSFFFLTSPNIVRETNLNRIGVKTIVSDAANPGEALLAFLRELHQAVNQPMESTSSRPKR